MDSAVGELIASGGLDLELFEVQDGGGAVAAGCRAGPVFVAYRPVATLLSEFWRTLLQHECAAEVLRRSGILTTGGTDVDAG